MTRQLTRLALALTLACTSSAIAASVIPPAWSNSQWSVSSWQYRTAQSSPSSVNWVTLTPSVHPTSGRALSLWSTYYHIYQAQETTYGYPLLDRSGRALAYLSHRDWCYAALQGTVQVQDRSGNLTTYNFAGRGSRLQLDCSAYFKSLSPATLQKTGRVRFGLARGPHGDGAGGYRLVPYRTIAVDRQRIPLGSVVYIPAARGQHISLPNGETIIHDGYFFAADVGSAIKGNQIDVFVGSDKRSPFPFITSNPRGTFPAFVVQDPQINQVLSRLHR
ncbi:3D domain-containing protein [Roseofilum capinflatum]|uniref:3D domain-containing protein n=1 Tax=Roseofilum capinflatum BLCC-M114 TaxID=3022440 RepID=A0ABT7B8P4_9CYAN|nr:3D domain-containing protein [Roseofilum capinflatum]MDJ1175177.1 3D domain-containing protein [Roseofilum capinflatum BLCC-M114]